MKKRMLSLALCAVLLVSMLAGCNAFKNATLSLTDASSEALKVTGSMKVSGIGEEGITNDAREVFVDAILMYAVTDAEKAELSGMTAGKPSLTKPSFLKKYPSNVFTHTISNAEVKAFLSGKDHSTFATAVSGELPSSANGEEVMVRAGFIAKAVTVGDGVSGKTNVYLISAETKTLSIAATPHNITVAECTNGTATVDKTSAVKNEKVTVTATPAPGYAVDTIKVNDAILSGDWFIMPDNDVTVTVTFKPLPTYTITNGTTDTNGTVSIDKTSTWAGDTVTVTATPATGYAVDAIKVNGTAIQGSTFTMPAQDTTVVVTFKAVDYTVTLSPVTNGTASVDKTTANYGDTITVTATPNTGYELDSITVNGTAITGTTFTMPAENVTVVVTFKAIEYKVTVPTATNGTASVDKTTANYGDTITVTATPDTGYELDSIKVNGEAITGTTFTMPAEDVTVVVTFKAVDYTITNGTTDKNGKVSIDKDTAHYGDTVTVTATPDAGYTVDAITVNGEAITGTTFTMPAENVTVVVTFKAMPKYGIVNATTDENGTVTIDKTTAYEGETVTVTATPKTGYELNTIVVKDASNKTVTVANGVFTMPASDVTVTVTFKALHTHNYGAWKTDSEKHWKECACGEIAEEGNHTFNQDGKCTKCGYTHAYEIIKGANGTWDKKSTATGYTLVSNAPFDKFVKVTVDGTTVAKTNYTVKEGSTSVTLKKAYLDGLTLGKHTVKIQSSDGYASTNLTIKYTSSTAKTGDNANLMLWVVLLLTAVIALTTTVIYGKTKKNRQ